MVRSGRWAAGLGCPCSRAESSGVSVASVTGTISWPHSRRQRLRGAASDDSCSRGRGSWCPLGAVWGQAQAAAGGRDPVSRALCRHGGCRCPTRAPRRPGPRGGLQSNNPSPLPAAVPRPGPSLPSLAESVAVGVRPRGRCAGPAVTSRCGPDLPRLTPPTMVARKGHGGATTKTVAPGGCCQRRCHLPSSKECSLKQN